MKIVQVISSLANGGAEKFVVELSNELSLSNQVLLISIKDIEDWMYPPQYLSKRVNLLTLGKKKGFDLNVLSKLYKLVRSQEPNVVHIHLNMSMYYFLPLIPLFKKTKFFFTIHNTFGPHKKLLANFNRLPFYRRVSNICLTEGIYKLFHEEFPKLHFYKIENGIKRENNKQYYEDLKKEIEKLKVGYKYIYLFVGRFSYQKNIPLLLDVFSDASLADSKLIIIGDGNEETKTTVIRHSALTNNRIQYLGKKKNIFDYMNSVDALVLTSRHEGLPIVILEALSVGLPIISSPVGGILDVIDNKINGFLAKGLTKQDILEAIAEFRLLEPSQIDIMKNNNHNKFSNKYSIEVCSEKHIRLYTEVCKHG